MTERIIGPTGSRRRRRSLLVPLLLAFAGALALGVTSSAVILSSTCTLGPNADGTIQHLADSNFEIDAILQPPAGSKKNTPPTMGANLKVDATGCIDWAAASVGETRQNDGLTGSGDSAFGQGTAENDAVPTIVTDSIPPNKSDLKSFDVYEEFAGTKTFVAVDWSRINSPQGTTNMDFEFNQNSCGGTIESPTPSVGGCSANGVTPARLSGDKLLIFNLSSGGTVVDILIRTWDGTVWANETTLNSSSALGSINYDAILSGDADGLGALDSLTFGEAIIDFQALLGGPTCGSFGSVYLKSRSSDSFTAELKDFVPPKAVTLTNCAAIVTSADTPVTVGDSITDTATLSNVSGGAGGTITFSLYAPSDPTCSSTPVFTDTVNVNGPGDYTSASYATTEVGTYRWIASYSGDAGNSAISGECGDEGESSVVDKASPTLPTSPSAGGTVGAVTLNDSATVTGGYNPTGTVTFNLYDPDQSGCTGTPRYTETVTLSGGSASTSPGLLADKAGTWQWTASYSGDDNNNTASSGCTAEPVVVDKASPTIGTTPNPTSGNIGVVLNDSASLTGAYNPTGTITFNLYDPDQSTCTGTPRFTETVAVSAGGASTTSGFTTDKAGTWRWTATYSGDANNNDTSSGCDAEQVTVNLIPSAITTEQKWYPQDTATIGGGGGGTVDFALYKNDSDCDGTTPVYTEDDVAVSSGTASTSNSTFAVTSVAVLGDAYYWKASYSGDASHEPVSSCVESTEFASLDNGGTVNSG